MTREDASEIEISYEAASSQVLVDLYNHIACLLFDNNDARVSRSGAFVLIGIKRCPHRLQVEKSSLLPIRHVHGERQAKNTYSSSVQSSSGKRSILTCLVYNLPCPLRDHLLT